MINDIKLSSNLLNYQKLLNAFEEERLGSFSRFIGSTFARNLIFHYK